LCTYVQVFLSTLRIFPEWQIFTKNYRFWQFLGPYGDIFKEITKNYRFWQFLGPYGDIFKEIWHAGCVPGAPSSRQNFVKIA